MPNIITTGAAVLAAIAIPNIVRADNCAQGSSLVDGNWYCQAVTAIQYTNVGGSGSYNRITAMDSTTGSCSSESHSYSGSIAPLNEEVSLHFRGPLELKQFAAYVPSSSSSDKAKRDVPKARLTPHARRHGHGHFHAHNKEVRKIQEKAEAEAGKEKRGYEVWVTATIDGKAVSWVNDFSGNSEATATPVADSVDSAEATETAGVAMKFAAAPSSSSTKKSKASKTASSSSVATSESPADSSSSGSWSRTGYYDSSSGSSTGLTFLNNYGGSDSGTFDYVFGNSLSYANSAGTGPASSSTVLDDITIESNKEVIIMTDTSCDDEDGCGFYRDGTVAYHGFDGSQKIFLIEFSMPDDGTSGTDMNMPAIWMLNAQVPRTLQYGSAECSCWKSGCGEFDIFETLTSGSTRCKSTFHTAQAAGCSDYFIRPVDGTIKLAVVMMDGTAMIKVLSNSYDISSSLSAKKVQQLASETWSDISNKVVSKFPLSS